MSEAWLGVDLGGTNTKLGLVDRRGSLLCRADFPTLHQNGPADWLDRLSARARQMAGETGASLQGAGIASPGVLDRAAGRVVFSPNLPSMNGFGLGPAAARALGLPVALENDANLFAFGEALFGAGRGREAFACFTLGTGVGGGVVMLGRPVAGPLGIGGELGHLPVVPGGRPCGCGARGCLEAYASATGLAGMLAEALAGGRETSLAPGADPGAMAAAARRGDALAGELFDRAGRAMGRAAAILAVTLGLDLLAVGGGVARAWDLMERAALEELAKSLHLVARGLVCFKPAELGEDAPLLGAAAWARQAGDSRFLPASRAGA